MTYPGGSEQMTLQGEMGNGCRGDAPSNTALLLRQRFVKEDDPQGGLWASKSSSRNLGPLSTRGRRKESWTHRRSAADSP